MMGKISGSLKINYIMNSLLSFASAFFPLITIPYLSRVLLAYGVGKVNFALNVVLYFNMFAKLGIPVYGIRACAEVRDDREELSRVTHELLAISLITSVLSCVFLFVIIRLVPVLYDDKILYVIFSFIIFLEAVGMEWLFKALEQYTYITVRSLVFKLIAICIMFLMVKDSGDYVYYALVILTASYASLILNLFGAKKYIYLKPVGNYDLKRHMKSIMIFFFMACATTVYTNLDEVMLGFMAGDDSVGYYHAAVRVKSLLVALITSLGAVLLPRLSHYVEQGLEADFKRICNKAVNYILITALPLTVFFIILAGDVIALLAGSAFLRSVSVMQIIMPTVFLIGITNILGIQILVPTGREKYVLYSVMAGALTDLVMNLLFIPVYGPDGAAVGTLLAEIVVLLIQLCFLREEMGDFFKGIQYLRIVAVLLISTALLMFLCVNTAFSPFVTLIVFGSVFFLAYGVLLVLFREKLTMELMGDIRKYMYKNSDKRKKD